MLVVDTFNVLHAARKIDSRLVGMRIEDLCELVAMGRYSGEPIVLVVDGTGGGRAKADAWGGWTGVAGSGESGKGAGVKFLYAGAGKDADSMIEQFLDERERQRRGRATTVVSNDKRVLAAAVGVRAKTMTSDEFVRTLVLDAGKAVRREQDSRGDRPEFASGEGLDAAATGFWMREFGEAPALPSTGPIARDPGQKGPSASIDLDAATLEAINQWAREMDLDDHRKRDEPPAKP